MRVWWLAVWLTMACASTSDVPSPVSSAKAVADEPLGGRVHWLTLPSERGKVMVQEAGEPRAGLPPILLVHGLGIGSRDFARVFEPLSEGHHVFAVDLPGFGRSARGGAYTPDRYVRTLGELVDGLGLPQVDLVGHSMGGSLCVLYASFHPERVRRLVLADVAGVLHQEALVSDQLEDAIQHATRGAPRTGRAAFGPFFALGRALRSFGPDLGPFTRYHMLDGSPGMAAAVALVQYDFGPAISRVTAATLLVWGDQDRVAPTRTADVLYDRLPVARYVRLDHVGHVPMVEAPELFVNLVGEFLGSSPVPTRAPEPAGDQGDVQCRGQRGVHLSGRYRRIELVGCKGAVLRDVQADTLHVAQSDARLTHVSVTNGAQVVNSSLWITGGAFAGDIALDVGASHLDAAGLVLRGAKQPLRCTGASHLLFSATRTEGPSGFGFLHGEARCRADAP